MAVFPACWTYYRNESPEATAGDRAFEESLMSQAIVDPAELRRFAQQLSNFNTELEERLSTLASQLHSLNSSWRDQEHKKFSEEFEHYMKLIARSMESSNEYVPFLLRKAERIEEYLQQR